MARKKGMEPVMCRLGKKEWGLLCVRRHWMGYRSCKPWRSPYHINEAKVKNICIFELEPVGTSII